MNIEGAPFVYLSPLFRNPADAAAGVFDIDVVAVHVLYVTNLLFQLPEFLVAHGVVVDAEDGGLQGQDALLLTDVVVRDALSAEGH